MCYRVKRSGHGWLTTYGQFKVELLSYQVEDFIPFTADVYLALLVRVNDAYWPLQIMLFVVALVALFAPFSHKVIWNRWVCAGAIALLWVGSGIGFLYLFYSELVWISSGFAIAFCLQAILSLLCILLNKYPGSFSKLSAVLGVLFCTISLMWPLLTGWYRDGWNQAEWIGIHPDPTALFGLGMALLVLRSWRMWLCCLIPISWLILSIVTQHTLGLLTCS